MNDSLRMEDFDDAMVRARHQHQTLQRAIQRVGFVPTIETEPKAVLKAVISLITIAMKHGDTYSLLEAMVLLEELDNSFDVVTHTEWKRKAGQ